MASNSGDDLISKMLTETFSPDISSPDSFPEAIDYLKKELSIEPQTITLLGKNFWNLEISGKVITLPLNWSFVADLSNSSMDPPLYLSKSRDLEYFCKVLDVECLIFFKHNGKVWYFYTKKMGKELASFLQENMISLSDSVLLAA